jgi:hypothetical protein
MRRLVSVFFPLPPSEVTQRRIALNRELEGGDMSLEGAF